MDRGITHSRSRFLVAACLALIFGSSQVNAQTPEGFDEWRQKILRLCDWEVPLDALRIRWRLENLPGKTAAQLETLERAAANRPHSDEAMEVMIERRALDGKAWFDHEMWLYGGEYRKNADYGTGTRYDHVLRGDRAWSMTDSSLTHFANSGKNSGAERFQDFGVHGQAEFRTLLTGGLSSLMPGLPTFAKAVPVVNGTKWSIDAPIVPPIHSMTRIEASGTILGGGRFTTDFARCTIEREGEPKPIIVEYRSKEWIEHPAFETGIATEVNESGQAGFPRRFRFISAETIDEDEFERVTAPPRLGESDAIRGPVTANSFEDYYSDSGKFLQTSVAPDGSQSHKALPVPGAAQSGASASRIMIGGLAILAVLAAIIVWRLRRG
jgi:hypothetical protein